MNEMDRLIDGKWIFKTRVKIGASDKLVMTVNTNFGYNDECNELVDGTIF